MIPELSIITCTGDRPLAFELCAKYVFRQERLERVQWVVVDDGDCHKSTLTALLGAPPWLNVNVLRMATCKSASKSFRANMSRALSTVTAERIIFMEDDEWYSPRYAVTMFERLQNYDLVGEAGALYYNVKSRLFRRWGNAKHSSMCQTGMKTRSKKALQKLLKGKGTVMVDRILWKKKFKKRVFPSSRMCVSIKGMPGRSGLGVGHRPRKSQYDFDRDGGYLRRILGRDADVYLELYAPKKVKVK